MLASGRALGQALQALLQAPQPPAVEPRIAALINEIAALDTSFVFVLDDYHAITLPAIHEAMAFLLGHMPPQLHLVIAFSQRLNYDKRRDDSTHRKSDYYSPLSPAGDPVWTSL